MSNPDDIWIEREKSEIRNDWFKTHVATIQLNTPELTLVKWQKPDSWIFGCKFIIHRRWLTVLGDIGEAVYEWSEDISLQFVANCGLHYFLGKCQASEDGRKFKYWESQLAMENAAIWLAEMEKEGEGSDRLEVMREIAKLGKAGKDEYQTAANDAFDSTGDSEFCCQITSLGTVPHPRAIGHWIGIQMAVEQLKAGGKLP